MLSNIGAPGFILILIIALVLFGPSKLPEMGRAVGTTIREFKKSMNPAETDQPVKESQKVENQEAKVMMQSSTTEVIKDSEENKESVKVTEEK